jgi:hypothetical protein
MAKVINVKTVHFDFDNHEISVYGFCSNCGQKVFQNSNYNFPDNCPKCNDKLDEVVWDNQNLSSKKT